VTWTKPAVPPSAAGITCCYCGRRAPTDGAIFVRAGWQVRYDYPLRYRCRRCQVRQEPEAA